MPVKSKTTERGLALVITLLITAILVAVITEIVFAVHINTEATRNYKDSQEASLLAQGGIELMKKAIEETMKGKSHTAFNEDDIHRVFVEGNKVLSIKIEDEQCKISANSIVFRNGETNNEYYDTYSRLLYNLELEEGLVDTLADWIDINDLPRAEGAESYDYYERLSPAYRTKGSPLDSVEELMLIKGYTFENHKVISPFITVYTDGKININTAQKEVIMALSNDITEEMAQSVIKYRKKIPFKVTADIRKVSGFETIGFDLQNRITVKSNTFRIFSRATVGESVREVEAVIHMGGGGRTLFRRER
jgi:general secretion pathway protein K